MSKPIGYYVDTNIPVIAEIERKYGSNLEGMSKLDKMYLISSLSKEMTYSGMGKPPQDIKRIEDRIFDNLDPDTEAIALLKAIVNNL